MFLGKTPKEHRGSTERKVGRQPSRSVQKETEEEPIVVESVQKGR